MSRTIYMEKKKMNEVDDRRLIDVKSAANYLGISENSLRQRILKKQIEGVVKWHGRVFFDRKKLDDFIDHLADEK